MRPFFVSLAALLAVIPLAAAPIFTIESQLMSCSFAASGSTSPFRGGCESEAFYSGEGVVVQTVGYAEPGYLEASVDVSATGNPETFFESGFITVSFSDSVIAPLTGSAIFTYLVFAGGDGIADRVVLIDGTEAPNSYPIVVTRNSVFGQPLEYSASVTLYGSWSFDGPSYGRPAFDQFGIYLFSIEFVSTPEPSSVSALALGLLGFAVCLFRGKR